MNSGEASLLGKTDPAWRSRRRLILIFFLKVTAHVMVLLLEISDFGRAPCRHHFSTQFN
jgi:hypothetical protein